MSVLIAKTVLSIRPGNQPAAIVLLKTAMDPIGACFLAAFYTEIGEVNTLTCLHELRALQPDLAEVQAWADRLALKDETGLLRSVSVDVYRSDACADEIAALAAPGVAAVLARQIGGIDVQGVEAGVTLRPLTGLQRHIWCFTPVAEADQALGLNQQMLNDTARPLLASMLLKVVRELKP